MLSNRINYYYLKDYYKRLKKHFATKYEDIPVKGFLRCNIANSGPYAGAHIIEEYHKDINNGWEYNLYVENKLVESYSHNENLTTDIVIQYNKCIRDLLIKEANDPADEAVIKRVCGEINRKLWISTF